MTPDQIRYKKLCKKEMTAIEIMDCYSDQEWEECEKIMGWINYANGSKEKCEFEKFKHEKPAMAYLLPFRLGGFDQGFFDTYSNMFEKCGEKIDNKNIIRTSSENTEGLLTSDGTRYAVGPLFHRQVAEWLDMNNIDITNIIAYRYYPARTIFRQWGRATVPSKIEFFGVDYPEFFRQKFIEISQSQAIAMYNICQRLGEPFEDSIMNNNTFGFNPHIMVPEEDEEIEKVLEKSNNIAHKNLTIIHDALRGYVDEEVLKPRNRKPF